MKIGQYLAKIWTRIRVLLFLRHGVVSVCSAAAAADSIIGSSAVTITGQLSTQALVGTTHGVAALTQSQKKRLQVVRQRRFISFTQEPKVRYYRPTIGELNLQNGST